ncbi:hypothetical protein NE237_024477 [Protea cynaroides]|uniref:RING-type domain-containing protein n=1 Tax=Protea cynaroides TaxID=273540 RepID=A0A9Q0GZZ7_9MAGN|nr:hypothetical protein NE237_024477 [Protea cynaroides]
MENLDHKEEERDGAGLNDSTTRSGPPVGYFVFGSSSGNASSGNTFGPGLSFELGQNNTGERSNNNNSVHAAPGNANSLYRRRRMSSGPYSMFHEAPPVDHVTERPKGGSCSKPKVPVLYGSSSCQAPPAIDELKLIENIADILSPSEVTHFLFQGHENENIARPLLNPNIGSNLSSQGHQNDTVLGQLHPRPHLIDLRLSCIYCYQTVSIANPTVSKRSCGHYFHLNCFHHQSESMKGQHMWVTDCQFCQLERR